MSSPYTSSQIHDNMLILQSHQLWYICINNKHQTRPGCHKMQISNKFGSQVKPHIDLLFLACIQVRKHTSIRKKTAREERYLEQTKKQY